MDNKRLFTAFFLIFLFLTVYSYLGNKYVNKQHVQVSSSQPSPVTNPSVGIQHDVLPSTPIENEELKEIYLGNFFVTYSATSGYVKKVFLEEYKDENLLITDIGRDINKTERFSTTVSSNTLTFVSPSGYQKEYVFSDNSITLTTFSRENDSSSAGLVAFSYQLSNDLAKQNTQEIFYSRESIIERKAIKKAADKFIDKIDYAGARTQYFCTSLVKGVYDLRWQKDNKGNVAFLLPSTSQFTIYIGPQTAKKLKIYGLQGIINYGFFHSIGNLIAQLLFFTHGVTKSWGLGVIILALIMYLALFPFTMLSTKAMKKMQEIQPEMEALKIKYKDNPQKLNQATLDLYREYRVNPLGGCLPVLLQFPVFIALYQVFLRLPELKNSQFLWIKDLALPDHLVTLPFPSPFTYINIFPILIAIIGLIQQRYTTSASMTPEQKKMGLFFSVFMGVIFYNFPASMSIYWFVQNSLTLAYQAYLNRRK